jgi:transglutaminase-like putative cysteine protease
LACIAVVAVTITSGAQGLQDYKTAYPDFNEVILNDHQSYNFSVVDKKLRIIQDNHFESMILSEHGIQNNSESFSYSELVKLKGYDAWSVLNENGKERKVKVTQSSEKHSTQSSVFYDNVKERHLTFPNLEAGAKKIYNYQREFLDPYLLHKFVFGSSLPVKSSTLEIVVSKDINIGYKIFNDPTNAIAFEKTEKKGKWVYTWTLNDIKPVKYEDNSPGYLHLVPHIDVYIKDYKVDNKNVEVLDDVNKLYNYYKGFVNTLNKTEDAALRVVATELTASATSNTEKVKRIFYWVKDNIKYIAFENGYEGFIPREAALVNERKFGDCKDMASIITAMAKYAGVDNVTLSWIGTREIPYSYAELSTPAVDNHMIAVYEDKGEYVFLDATDKSTRFGIPTAFIQGKEALLNVGDSFRIVKVPVVPAHLNETVETVLLKIAGDRIIGNGKMTFTGYSRSRLLDQIGDASNKARFELMKSLTVKGSNKFNLIDYSEENIEDRDKPYVVNYHFDLDSYIVTVDNELYVNLNLDKAFQNVTIERDRTSKFEFEYLTLTNNSYELEIPKDYQVKYLPKDFSIDNDVMSTSSTYTKKADKVVLSVQIKLKKLLLETSDFAVWNETIQKLKANYNELLILSKK